MTYDEAKLKRLPLSENIIVRVALVNLRDLLKNKTHIFGDSNFYPVKMILFDKTDLELSVPMFEQSVLHKPIVEWANTIPSLDSLKAGALIYGGSYERYDGVGMCGFLSKRSDGRVQLMLQVFDE